MNITFYSGRVEPRLTFLYGSIMTLVENETAHRVRTLHSLCWDAPVSPRVAPVSPHVAEPRRQVFEPFCFISLAFIWHFWEGFNLVKC